MIRVAKELRKNLVDVKVLVMETYKSSDDKVCGNAHDTQIVVLNDIEPFFNRQRQKVLQN